MHTKVLRELICDIYEIYIDDTHFWGSSDNDFLVNFETISAWLSVKAITLNPKNCQAALEKVEYKEKGTNYSLHNFC